MMKLPLVLISLDDKSVGVFTDEKALLLEIETPDIDNYRVFDAEGLEFALKLIRKSFSFLGSRDIITIIKDSAVLKGNQEDLIDYIVSYLDYCHVSVPKNKRNDLLYLLHLLVNIKGFNKF